MSSSTVYYPVLTLPREITTEFFLHCLPLLAYPHHVRPFANASTRLQVRDTGPVLLKLSQVCLSWRDIINKTPTLWAALTLFSLHSPLGAIAPRDVVRTTTWLARARDCPLTLIMHTQDSCAWRRRRFFNTFRRSALRMRVLELDMTRRDLKVMAVATSFPALEQLALRVTDYYYSTPKAPIQVFAPLLREVVLYELKPELEVVLPWTQLTKLTAAQYTMAACFTILSLTPNLTECRLSVYSRMDAIRYNDRLPPAAACIVLPRLRILKLFQSHGEHPPGEACSADVLEFLDLPALRVLEIIDLDPDTEVRFLTAFLTRSSPLLHTLTLHQKGGTSTDVAAFALMPQLVRLEIWRPTAAFADALFEEVFARGGARAMLPQLQILALLGCDPPTTEESHDPKWTMMDAFERRTSRDDLIDRREWADGLGEKNIEEIFSRFKALAAWGLDVRIEKKTRP